MMIYDCFTFFNEFEILKIRLSELYDEVDYFVIVEGNKTHSGEKKAYNFKEKSSYFKKWEKKIIYVPVELPSFNTIDRLLMALEKTKIYKIGRWVTITFGFGRWKLERAQRRAISSALKSAEEEDIIMVSDIDEIPRASKIALATKMASDGSFVAFENRVFYYFLNGLASQKWIGTRACSFKYLNKKLNSNPDFMRIPGFITRLKKRTLYQKDIKIIKDGGWHFSYLGGVDNIIKKRMSTAHTEISSDEMTDSNKIIEDIKNGIFFTKDLKVKLKYVNIDDSFPKTIYKNINKYKKLIMQNG